jgi:hypothetical protein
LFLVNGLMLFGLSASKWLLLSFIQQSGDKAVGLRGKFGDLLRARQMVENYIGRAFAGRSRV